MAITNLNYLICILLLCIYVNANTQIVHKRFEYKYSFKPPYLAQKDGSVPFWEYGGNAIASGDSVRLAPSLRSQKGAIWSKQQTSFDWWEVDIMFKVTGRGRIGADGLAFWYTTERGDYTGDVFGSSDRWTGLAIIFDSFDNDNKHNNPYIMAVLNDGTKSFDHKSDGSTQLVAGCLRDFRNKPFPTRAKIEYFMNTLTVYFHNGMSTKEEDYEVCLRAERVALPPRGLFGLSAATGGLADDHDVVHLLTSSLHAAPAADAPASAPISSAEQHKLSQEYQDYQKKLEQQKEDYRKEHPDETRDRDADAEDWFESDGARELRQIFGGQQQIYDVLRELNKKVDEVVGKQVNALSLLSAVYAQGQGQAPPGQQGQPGQPPQLAPPPVGRHEWDALLANHQIVINTVAELKGYIVELSRKDASSELREGLAQVARGVQALAARPLPQLAQQAQPGPPCPEPSCLSLSALLVVVATQLLLMLLYSLYKEKKEAQAKKFF